MEEGVRSEVPFGPPPFPELTPVSPLLGVTRSEIIKGLGRPRRCWAANTFPGAEVPCRNANHHIYPFFRLRGRPGGGLELHIRYEDDRVTRAEWFGSQ